MVRALGGFGCGWLKTPPLQACTPSFKITSSREVYSTPMVGKATRDWTRRGISGLLKRWLLGTHQGAVAPQHLSYYLDEFTFRFNRRTSRSGGKLFYRLLQQAAAT